jgi:hypothetical protein
MGGAVGAGDAQEVRLLECVNLGVERVPHAVEPAAGEIGVVPNMLRAAVIGRHRIKRRGVP